MEQNRMMAWKRHVRRPWRGLAAALLAMAAGALSAAACTGPDCPRLPASGGSAAEASVAVAPVPVAPVPVASRAALLAALKAVRGGETLLLAPGDYGAVRLTGGRDITAAPAAPVTLRSADPARPARFAGFELRDLSGLVIEDVTFAYRHAPGDQPDRTAPFRILGSRGITLRRVLFSGDRAGEGAPHDIGYGTGIGLQVRGGGGILVEECEFRTWLRGAGFANTEDITLRGNDIHDIRSDGLNFADVQGLLAERNHIHDFRRAADAPDHSDMIQFWTAGTTRPSRDVVIRDNVLNAGGGTYTQSIFMGNEVIRHGQAGFEMAYRNIAITNNVIVNAHLHGISVAESIGLTIAGNTLIRNFGAAGEGHDDTLWTPRINVAPTAREVTIRGNAAAGIEGHTGQPGWTVGGNVVIQGLGPSRPGYYYHLVFADALRGDPRDLRSFTYRPGGPLDGVQAGSSLLRHGAAAPASGP